MTPLSRVLVKQTYWSTFDPELFSLLVWSRPTVHQGLAAFVYRLFILSDLTRKKPHVVRSGEREGHGMSPKCEITTFIDA